MTAFGIDAGEMCGVLSAVLVLVGGEQAALGTHQIDEEVVPQSLQRRASATRE